MFSASKQRASPSSTPSSSSSLTSSFSSSCCTPEWRYDVFLGFRGLDTRNNFSDHLYNGLVERGIKVFRDDKRLGKGKVITKTIFGAIKMSRFSIVVFSRNYACSEWCLDELVKIVVCMKEEGHLVFPIFYHVSPDDVMNQMGHYKEAFLRHQQIFEKERIQIWRAALTEIAGICGWDAQNYRSESKLVKSIVENVSRNLRCTSPSIGKGLNPFSSQMKDINLYLYEGLDNVFIVRICGMDGMGGTTIARVVYDAVFNEKLGLVRFPELVSEMPRKCRREICDFDRVFNEMRKTLQHKKVVVLIDDVNTLELVASLVRRDGWFVPGGRIIISARTPNKMILNVLDISFHEPKYRENVFDISSDEPEDENSNISLDIACFFKEMDDDHVTRILRSLVSGDLQTNSGMKVLIDQFLINVYSNDNLLMYDFLQDLNWEIFLQKNLREPGSRNKLLNMAGINRLAGDCSKSSQFIWKSKNKPRKGSTDKQCRNLCQNLSRDSLKVKENEACDVSLDSRSSGISDARHAIAGEDSTTKIQSVLSFQDELLNVVACTANGDTMAKSPTASAESLEQNLGLKMTNSKCSSSRIKNGEKEIFRLKSPETILDDLKRKGKNVASSTNRKMNESSGPGLSHNIEAFNQGQKDASFLDSQIVIGSKSNNHQLQYFFLESSNGKKIVRIPKVVVEEGIKQWDLCLVGQLLGAGVEISQMFSMANELWGKEGRIEVIKTENELYVFKFPDERTRDLALESGPWFIENSPLVMRRWQPKMQLLELDKSKIPVWVKLKGVPMEYMTVQGLSYIASALGKPLYMDRATASKSRLAFAKVCVQMSVEDEIMENISVMDDDGEELVVEVEYFWKPDKCIACREFGHSSSRCPHELIGKVD